MRSFFCWCPRDGAEFAWVPHGSETCPMCLTIASNGWRKASKKTMKGDHADHIHGNCDCEYAIRFDGKSTVEGYDPDALREQYDNAEGSTWKQKVNSMRRDQYKVNGEKIRAQKRAAYARRKGYRMMHTYDDPIREKLGSAEESHPKKLAKIKKWLIDNGIKYRIDTSGRKIMGYMPNPRPGKPGEIVMESGASISAWMHERQHALDDMNSGWKGFRNMANINKYIEFESKAYDLEIDFAQKCGYDDIVKRLRKLKQEAIDQITEGDV